jgi:hypothetical protein
MKAHDMTLAPDIYAADRERIRRTDWRRVHVEADRREPVWIWARQTKEVRNG